MHEGMSLIQLATEMERQVKERKDFLVPLDKVEFASDGGRVQLHGLPIGPTEPTDWTHSQLSTYFKIPKPYYDRMREERPDLLAHNLNTWIDHDPTPTRMVRTLDARARAWLSNSYRCLNNEDLAAYTLPILKEHGAIVRSSAITETRLYLKATLPTLEAKVTGGLHVGDVIRGGVMMRNSDVGNGALEIAFFVERLRCLNGMISESLFRRAHLGRRIGKDLSEATELFSDKTRKLDDAAFFSKVRDVLLATLKQEYIEEIASKASVAATDVLPKAARLEEIIEITATEFSLPNSLTSTILHNLITDGDLSRWGVANAITRTAEDVPDYEVATLLEQAGGRVIDLSSDEWREMLPAAA